MEIRIATRKSELALWQAKHVARKLEALPAVTAVSLVPMSTRGDEILDNSLQKIGGKGLFIKELEVAMLAGDADIAVHSMKDVPAEMPAGFCIAALLERANPTDAFVSGSDKRFVELPAGAKIGSSSLRRQAQLRAMRPDIEVIPLRGNVNTRLRKLADGEYDAIILATAGLMRLGFEERIRYNMEPSESLPAIGQGVLGIECRTDDARTNELLAPLHHADTASCVLAERAMNARLEGGCQVPIGGHALLEGDLLWLRGLVGTEDGSEIIRAEIRGPRADAEALGTALAEELLDHGAAGILKELYDNADG